jgi:hypothetical protein
MLELFVEVLDSQTAKLVPVSKIAKPVPEKYELRLIVWKCEGIPLGERDAVDIFFKVQFDPSGWLSESKEKETDVHAGSEDGHGIFNWRNFARIRIVSYDFSTFGTDEMISEVVLDLARYFRRVMKEGKLTQEEQWIDLIIPGEHPKPGGKVMISFTILSQAEADNTPVGEGQDEPNRDPELEKPEEGRGIMDFLKGTALDVSKWSLFNFGLLKKLLMLLSLWSCCLFTLDLLVNLINYEVYEVVARLHDVFGCSCRRILLRGKCFYVNRINSRILDRFGRVGLGSVGLFRSCISCRGVRGRTWLVLC